MKLKQLVILSGKGGTGKTIITAALAHLASQELSVVLADADVDAANLELVLAPTKQEEHEFFGGQVAVIDAEKCTSSGVCSEVCRFDAVLTSPSAPTHTVDPLACEGCAACFYQCPTQAIRMVEQQAGFWFRSDTRFGPLFHAHLLAGQENSGKLVTLVKQRARTLALEASAALMLVDGSPGIGCPVISALAGADLTLLVVEPTVSGVSDLKRILATADHFGIPAIVAINKADLSPARSDEITAFCLDRSITIAGRIPYDSVVPESMVQGRPVTEQSDGQVTDALRELWSQTRIQLFSSSVPAG